MATCEMLRYVRRVTGDKAITCNSECMAKVAGSTCALPERKDFDRLFRKKSASVSEINVFDASKAKVLAPREVPSEEILVGSFEEIDA